MKDQNTGYSPFELTFGREPNISSTISPSPTLTHHKFIKKWKEKHERNLKVAKKKMEMEKTKKRLYESIVGKHPVYKSGNKTKIINKSKTNKIDPSWKGS